MIVGCATQLPVFFKKSEFYAEYLRFRAQGICHADWINLTEEKAQSIRACFESPSKRVQVPYRYEEGAWVLVLDESVPPCLIEELPRIEVPSEIMFLAPKGESDIPECFAAGLPKRKAELVLTLPRSDIPGEPKALQRVLVAWALSGFFEEGKLQAKRVPRDTCRLCFAEPQIFDTNWLRAHPTRLWP